MSYNEPNKIYIFMVAKMGNSTNAQNQEYHPLSNQLYPNRARPNPNAFQAQQPEEDKHSSPQHIIRQKQQQFSQRSPSEELKREYQIHKFVELQNKLGIKFQDKFKRQLKEEEQKIGEELLTDPIQTLQSYISVIWLICLVVGYKEHSKCLMIQSYNIFGLNFSRWLLVQGFSTFLLYILSIISKCLKQKKDTIKIRIVKQKREDFKLYNDVNSKQKYDQDLKRMQNNQINVQISIKVVKTIFFIIIVFKIVFIIIGGILFLNLSFSQCSSTLMGFASAYFLAFFYLLFKYIIMDITKQTSDKTEAHLICLTKTSNIQKLLDQQYLLLAYNGVVPSNMAVLKFVQFFVNLSLEKQQQILAQLQRGIKTINKEERLWKLIEEVKQYKKPLRESLLSEQSKFINMWEQQALSSNPVAIQLYQELSNINING